MMEIIMFVLVRVPISVRKHQEQKQLGDKNSLFHLTTHNSLTEQNQGRTSNWNVETRTDDEAMDEYHLLACSSWNVQPCFLYTQYQIPRGSTTHSGLGSPISITN